MVIRAATGCWLGDECDVCEHRQTWSPVTRTTEAPCQVRGCYARPLIPLGEYMSRHSTNLSARSGTAGRPLAIAGWTCYRMDAHTSNRDTGCQHGRTLWKITPLIGYERMHRDSITPARTADCPRTVSVCAGWAGEVDRPTTTEGPKTRFHFLA